MARDHPFDPPLLDHVRLAEPALRVAQEKLMPELLRLAAVDPEGANLAIRMISERLQALQTAAGPLAPVDEPLGAGLARNHAAYLGRSAARRLRDWQHLASRERTNLRKYVILAELEHAANPPAKQDLVAAIHREGFDPDQGDTENAIGTQLSRMKEHGLLANPPGYPGRFLITSDGAAELQRLRVAYSGNIVPE